MKKGQISDLQLLGLSLQNLSQTEISKVTGLSLTTVNKRVRKKDFQEVLRYYRDNVTDTIDSILSPHYAKAANTLALLLDDNNPYIKFSAAKQILSFGQENVIQKQILSEIEQLKQVQQEQIFDEY